MRLVQVLLIASGFFLMSNSEFDAETEQSIDRLVEDLFMPNNRIPGVGLSVVRNGTVLMSKGYGMRNISTGLPSDANTLFAIGSVTKTVVAVIVVKTLNELHPDRGAAVLDIPIAQLLPSTSNFTLSDRYRAEHTTFRDILSHRTCLLNGEIDLIFGSLSSTAEYVYRSRYIPQVCDFRNGFEYNNNMYSLAGELIASINGTTLENMIISLLRDIGMDDTTYVDLAGTFESHPNMSQPYILKNDTLVQFDIFQIRKVHLALASGGLLSTPNDMAKYMNFHLNKGRVDDRQIVPANVMSWMYTVSNPFEFEGGRTEDSHKVSGELGPTQGFFSALYDGWSLVRHTGYWAPYHCDMRLFLVTRIGVFLCTNGPGFIANYPVPATVISNIFDLVQGSTDILSEREVVGESLVDKKWMKGRRTNRAATVLHHHQIRSRVKAEDILGVYGHPHNGDISIRYAPGSNNTTLQIYFSQWAHGRLSPVPESNTTFSVDWDTNVMDHFHSYPSTVPNFWIDFGIVDTVLFRTGEWNSYNEFQFVKNATLDTFPTIPWTPTSCGPE